MKFGILKAGGIFAVGFFVGSLWMYKRINKEYVEQFNEEVDAIEEFYKSKYEEGSSESEENVEEEEESGEEPESDKPEEKRTFRSVVEKTSYNKMFGESNDDVDDPAESQSPKDDVADPVPPYIITPEEYSSSNLPSSHLTYYENADVLVEDDDIIDNPDYVVGREFKDRFGEYEEDVVYVRNEKLATDFEIFCDHTDARTVTEKLGYEPDYD